eukprot:CAMPEP_0119548160 /NCGR_PEP_ID=MMETSP1352-20130426/2143_1 /TAXON_ID=265584 /ORGANISM="Stauroneis constricta, Strain CCMP1120" /LENGTH=768 /DNA_ID=CAMNT_0007593349 /DNA_START=72 /DNA_END=2378 /DNA_ORIENTATION=+
MNMNDNDASSAAGSVEAGGGDEAVGVIDESGQFSVSTVDSVRPVGIKQQAARDERRTLGKRETRVIWILRLCVALTFVIMALSTSLGAYYYILDTETAKFEDEFELQSDQILTAFNVAVERKMAAVEALSSAYTIHALHSGSTFPNVTLPYFEYEGSIARIAGQNVMAFYMPLVNDSTKAGWLEYAKSESGEILRSIENAEIERSKQDAKFGLETRKVDVPDVLLDDAFVPNYIWGPNNDGFSVEPYLPIWQSTPLLPREAHFINLDLTMAAYAKGSLDAVLQHGTASLDVMSRLDDTTKNDNRADEEQSAYNLLIQFGQYRHSLESYAKDPITSLSVPVFDTFGDDKSVVGAIFTTMYWRLFFAGVFSDSVRGLLCVLENTQGQQATYVINGPNATFVAEGDHHSSQYDNMFKEIDLVDFFKGSSSPETRTFSAIDLDARFIDYKLRVYPTDEFKELYVTGEAKEDAIAIGSTFIIAFLVFIVYDCCVERRQRIVLDRAVKSTALVSTLFPENVRERVINDDEARGKGKSRQIAFRATNISGNQMIGGPPIAEKFAATTVFFADLAGFTKWSSTREPEQVFQLLEGMFKAFDAAALRRGVFKVETIGDCYMAVTGLPHPQADHAVRMAKFASDCLDKIAQIVGDLTENLGDDTSKLTLRIGMHSGGVTGGVLRGDKSRFQLFGDTVNTASRMESTGTPGRIQVSQATADYLILAGRGKWLTPREDKVFAKGKGEMQTYWINTDTRSTTSDQSRSSYAQADADAKSST